MDNSLVPFVIAGLTTGAVYGLAGSGLVITYKTSGIFNFAHGAMAAAAAYLFYWLTVKESLPWGAAFVISVPVLGVILGLVFEYGTRRMAVDSVTTQIIATIGVVLIVEALTTIKFGPDPLSVSQYLPGGTKTFHLFGAHVGWDQSIVIVLAVVLTLVLYVYLRRAKTGLAMRAVVDNSDLVGLHGTSPVQVRRVAWVLGSTMATISGVLLAPFVGVQAISMTYLVLAAVGAAAVGSFSNIPLTYVGGLVIGILADVSQKYVVNVGWLAGLPLSLPFLVLLLALVAIPKRRLVTGRPAHRSTSATSTLPTRAAIPLGAVALVFLLLVPTFAGTNLTYFMQAMSLGIMFLSLGLLVRTAGQVSLCQSVFGAIGAVTFSQLMVNLGLPWLLSLLLGALILVPIAALVAMLSIRLSGLFLALATLAFAILVERFFYPLSFVFGSSSEGRKMPRPSFAQSDKSFYYLLVVFFVLTALGLILINRGRLGRMLKGLSGSPVAIETLGLSINTTKILVFCVSAFLAGLSGILYGSTVVYATYGDTNYSSFESLVLLAIIVIAPLDTPWYALFAIPVAIIPGYIHGSNVGNWLTVLFGVSAVAVALQGESRSVPASIVRFMARFRSAAPEAEGHVTTTITPIDRAARQGTKPAQEPGLTVDDLRVRFGGLMAVDGVSLEAPIGRITGLIGPNGAGKTTLFNASSGVVRPTSGRIYLHGRDVTDVRSAVRARRGLGRTFQVTELCEALTVRENVAMGREAALAGAGLFGQVASSRSARKSVSEATESAIDICGIGSLAETRAGALSTGQRRLVEVARCLAGDFDVLLLDEPSAGLDRAENERLCDVLLSVLDQRHCGILLVEHDMEMVMQICEYIYVIEFGRPLFHGTPEAVAKSPEVRAAYLGSQAVDDLDPQVVTDEFAVAPVEGLSS